MEQQKTRGDGLGAIDDVLADQPARDDIDPQSIEARLRLRLPGHTYFRTEAAVPEPIRQLLGSTGSAQLLAQIGDRVVKIPTRTVATWSTPEGLWSVGVEECHSDGGYHLAVNGPDTDITRDQLSADQVMELLERLGVIS